MLGNLGPLLAVPGLIGLGALSLVSWRSTGRPKKGAAWLLVLLCELCLPYVKVGGLFLAMKSTDSGQELEDAAHCIKLLGGRVEEPFDYVIPGAGVTHRVIPIRKVAPTLKGYPRRWAKIQKAPL